MKKTIHINLAGHAFSIDEDAYERLDTYLKAVEKKLGNSAEARETLDDINLRIAELFRGVHSDAASAITLPDVEEIIKTLGDPGDYETPDDPDEMGEEKTTFDIPPQKKLYRDPDNRVLGGVCSGLANYFNLDPIVFRLLFIVATLLYGTSFLAYLILWIAIPKAVTIQQRIMMMGSAPASDSRRRRQPERTGGENALNDTLRVVGVIFGIFLIFFSFVSLTALFISFSLTDVLFGTLLSEGAWIPQIDTLFLMPEQRLMAFLGMSLTAGIPLLVLFYLGMHLVFRFKKGGPAFLITALILWLAGIGLILYTGVTVASGYAVVRSVEKTEDLKLPSSDTIYIEANRSSLDLGNGELIFSHDELNIRKQNNKLAITGTPEIDVNRGTETFRISVIKEARGKNSDEASDYATKIEFFHLQNDSVLMIDRYFSIQGPTVMRNQKVFIDIDIPEGKEIKISDDLKYLVDVSNNF
jgi:phage shock protein PspC (stress-responsive transcriptional regulator)